jgi:hypothetical protein
MVNHNGIETRYIVDKGTSNRRGSPLPAIKIYDFLVALAISGIVAVTQFTLLQFNVIL